MYILFKIIVLLYDKKYTFIRQETAPGKTCVVGAGYVALECAGFVAGLNKHSAGPKKCCDDDHDHAGHDHAGDDHAGHDHEKEDHNCCEVVVLVRSILLRGFDRYVVLHILIMFLNI